MTEIAIVEFAAAAHANWHVIKKVEPGDCAECPKFDAELIRLGSDLRMTRIFDRMEASS